MCLVIILCALILIVNIKNNLKCPIQYGHDLTGECCPFMLVFIFGEVAGGDRISLCSPGNSGIYVDQRSACLCLLNDGIKGVSHHVQPCQRFNYIMVYCIIRKVTNFFSGVFFLFCLLLETGFGCVAGCPGISSVDLTEIHLSLPTQC